jgi:membrane protein
VWIAITAALLALGFRRRETPHDAFGRAAPGQDAHGRFAATPSQIPARGWKDILWRCYERLTNDRLVAIAAGVTFYALLAIFPAIAALVAVYGLFADPGTIAKHLDDVAGFIPAGAIEVVRDELTRVSSQGNATLGLTFVVGLAVSLWSANAGMKALMDALNVAYVEREKRGFIRLNALSLAFTVGSIIILLIALGAVVVLPIVLKFVGLESQTEWIVALAKWPLLAIAIGAWISLLYRHGPSRREARWRWITWGSAFATIGWIAVSVLFSWYAANFGSYNKTYGSLGAVIGFMTWVWLSTIVILIGAELDAEMERQTFCDTTEGPPKPIGARGATVADVKGGTRG